MPSSGRNLPVPPLSSRSPRRPSYPHDTLPSISGGAPTSPYRRGHSRSISLTSPFSGRKQKGGALDIWDSDDSDDDDFTPLESASTSPRKGLQAPRGLIGDDLATGKCATCNATVRWPRNMNSYRCTACLMVNDLDTSKDVKSPGDTELRVPIPSNPTNTSPPSRLHRKEVPLSIDCTRELIGTCVSAYFRSLLDGADSTRSSPGDIRPGRSRDPSLEGSALGAAHSSAGTYLSASRPGDSRSRSASASSERERFDVTKENSAYLTPQAAHRDRKVAPRKHVPLRIRANSDLQSPKAERQPARPADPDPKSRRPALIFGQLEDYIIGSFKSCECLNNSFTTNSHRSTRPASGFNPPLLEQTTTTELPANTAVFEPDAKTLLLGDLAENSSWWMNEWVQAAGNRAHSRKSSHSGSRMVSSRSPRINWADVSQWYQLVLTAGNSWAEQWAAEKPAILQSDADLTKKRRWESIDQSVLERELADARLHLQRTLLKATENLLKRPRRPLKKIEDTRFLFILLANPVLYWSHSQPSSPSREARRPSTQRQGKTRLTPQDGNSSRKSSATSSARQNSSSHHYGLVKRILGLMSNMSNDCHHYFVSWFSRFSAGHFERLVELIGGFLTYRLTRQHGRRRSESAQNGNELVPSFASAAGNTPAELHAAINRRSPNKKATAKKETPIMYEEDWQIRAAARMMSLLFTANNANVPRQPDGVLGALKTVHRFDSAVKHSGHRQGHMLPISSFYNTLLDYSDLVADFEIWESRSAKFSFCQYPFFLSIWAKIHIMEHDARRQMEGKAREAFFNSILNHRAVSQYLVLKVRRDCLVEDSLRGVSEVVGSGQEEIKKGLRIEFVGEEGIDAGGLRKEWFLLLVREVFDPHHGLFVYDDDSNYCYFNPNCFESSEQFFLVGVLLGLAIYNSTILDIDLPPFAFKKLLAAAPQNTGPQPVTSARVNFKCTLDDLAELRPALAKGFRALLDFDGDVAETFCYDFVAQVDRYGSIVEVPLCAGGEKRPVTNSNRREFVDLYVHYLLDTAVARQFEPFKRGFFTVCGGNALSLFRPEEIELLIRGSDEPLDVLSLKAVAIYDNWKTPKPESVPVVQWFWNFFETAAPQGQRKILSFITGSDRIPAMGATSLTIKLACLGDDCSRYPIARTCFNTLALYRYATREKLQRLLWDAVVNSEGFGLK